MWHSSGASLAWGSPSKLADQQDLEILLFLPLQLWGYEHTPVHPAFSMLVLVLVGQALY